MIHKMTKYSIVLLSSELDSFLSSVQDLGLVDITRSQRPIDPRSKEILDTITRYKKVLRSIELIKAEKLEGSAKLEFSSDDLLDSVEQILAKRITIKNNLYSLRAELVKAQIWGDYHQEDLIRIDQLGYEPHFFGIKAKKYKKEWEELYPIQILNETGDRVFFVVLSPKGEELSFPINPDKFPERPEASIIEEIDRNIILEEENLSHCAALPQLTEQINIICSELEEKLELYLANVASKKEGEDTIAVLEGFAMTKLDASISSFLDSSSAIYIKEKAKAEDNPPVKLKNNFFTRPFEIIGNLYMLPKYNEVDLTPYFAPFYMMFFGLCLGDMGYGLVLLLVGLIASFAMPSMKNYASLIIFLGIGTIIMPLLSGTFFGMKLYDFIDLPEGINALFFTDIQMFWFGILFGIVHIIFAKLIKAIDSFAKKQWDSGLTNIGWSLVIVVVTFIYAQSEIGRVLLPNTLAMIMLVLGILLVVFCSKPNKKFYLRIIGLSSLYDITGIFGDVLSYIRLFGLGTAGAILGMVVNSVAMQMSGLPYIGWGLTIITLIVGHVAVLALSSLGAFVHPMRLTFVEFYKNAEFTGGGREFKPLKKQKNK